MFSYIIGSFFILMGIFSLFYPEFLRSRLRRKAVRKVKRYLFFGAFSLGILLISAGWKQNGILPKIIVLAGIIIILRGMFFLRTKVSDKVAQWILDQPEHFLKTFAVSQIIVGLLLVIGMTF